MFKKRGRPESFDAVKREELTELVKAGQSRHAAAVTLGVAPSTVSKRLRRDPAFAEAVEAAEKFSETDLLAIMRKHCEKSWHATRWLLEITYPQRYARRKRNLTVGPSVDELFDAVVGVLTEEIADESLRARIEARLDDLAAYEFVAAPAAPPEQESEIVENTVEVESEDEVEEVAAPVNNVPTNEVAAEEIDDAADEVAHETTGAVAHEVEPSEASDEASLDDVKIEPVGVPLNKPPIANLVKNPSKGSPRPRTAQRKKTRQDKRRRKECNKERKKQASMKLSAKQAKRRRRR